MLTTWVLKTDDCYVEPDDCNEATSSRDAQHYFTLGAAKRAKASFLMHSPWLEKRTRVVRVTRHGSCPRCGG